MYTNEIISYDLSLHPDLSQIKRMLDKAFKRLQVFKGLYSILIRVGIIGRFK